MTSFSDGCEFAHSMTFVPKTNSSLVNGNMPKIKSTPELSTKIIADLYGFSCKENLVKCVYNMPVSCLR